MNLNSCPTWKQIIIVILTMMVCSVALAQSPPTPAPSLPGDGSNHYIVIIANQGDTRISSWFDNHARLKQLRAKVHMVQFTPKNPLYMARYADSIPESELPAVLFCLPDGGVVYKASKSTLPLSADQLFDEMRAAYELAKIKPPEIETVDHVESSTGLAGLAERLRRPLRDSITLAPQLRNSINMQYVTYGVLCFVILLIWRQ